MPLLGTTYLRQNIKALIAARQTSQSALAFIIGMKDSSTLNKFLKGVPKRELQLWQVQKIAEHFEVEVYELYMPRVGVLDRRSGKERRGGRERRKAPKKRAS